MFGIIVVFSFRLLVCCEFLVKLRGLERCICNSLEVLKEVASVLARLIRICFELAELCAMNRI
jgi:hypothetical protein